MEETAATVKNSRHPDLHHPVALSEHDVGDLDQDGDLEDSICRPRNPSWREAAGLEAWSETTAESVLVGDVFPPRTRAWVLLSWCCPSV